MAGRDRDAAGKIEKVRVMFADGAGGAGAGVSRIVGGEFFSGSGRRSRWMWGNSIGDGCSGGRGRWWSRSERQA